MTTDLDLLEAWRGGDLDAGNELLARHFEPLARFFFNKATESEVEDLIQKTLLACVESMDRVRQLASFRSYLFTVARNELLMLYRRRYRQPGLDPSVSSVADIGTSPSSAVVAQEDKQLLLDALRRLPLNEQLLLELHYWEGLKAGELAGVFDVEPTTIRSRLSRSRQELKAQLEQLSATPELRQQALGGLETWARELHRPSS